MDPSSATTFPELTFQHSVVRRHHASMDTSRALPSRGHYMSASPTAVARASALRWVPYAAAVSTVRGLLGASHDDLALRVPMLTSALRATFFSDDAAAEQPMMVPPFSATSRFPEQELFVCADLSPVGPALQAVTQAMMQVAVKAAAEEACVCYYDAVGKLMRLLVDKGYGLGQVIFNRSAFESEFVLLWSPL